MMNETIVQKLLENDKITVLAEGYSSPIELEKKIFKSVNQMLSGPVR